jgi:hypothetical protein
MVQLPGASMGHEGTLSNLRNRSSCRRKERKNKDTETKQRNRVTETAQIRADLKRKQNQKRKEQVNLTAP